ncbi:MAG: RidA family protein [Gemmatimonadaceae bacterium]
MSEHAEPQRIEVPGWQAPHGYSDGMSARGRVVTTAGIIGWNPADGTFASDDLAEQVGQTLRNVVRVLAAAGAEPRHLVRLTWYLTDRDEYVAARRVIGEHYRSIVGRHYPAMAVVIVRGLLEPRAKVEIEATAVVPE